MKKKMNDTNKNERLYLRIDELNYSENSNEIIKEKIKYF